MQCAKTQKSQGHGRVHHLWVKVEKNTSSTYVGSMGYNFSMCNRDLVGMRSDGPATSGTEFATTVSSDSFIVALGPVKMGSRLFHDLKWIFQRGVNPSRCV